MQILRTLAIEQGGLCSTGGANQVRLLFFAIAPPTRRTADGNYDLAAELKELDELYQRVTEEQIRSASSD